MVDISSFVNKTLEAINNPPVVAQPRPYLGMSKIGHECNRYLWYSFRWCYSETLSRRQMRLFARGHREEDIVIEELQRIGIDVYGQQDGGELAFGHAKFHCDGKCKGVLEAPKTEHLFECKTMNDKAFKAIKKEGLKKSKPVYYAQCQIYMKKLKLTRALFVSVNKNDDEMYIERVKLDPGFAHDLERKAEYIVLQSEPPPKEFAPSWYQCKWCSAQMICHYEASVEQNCRTCEFVDLHNEGVWKCSKLEKILSTERQRIGCDEYSVLPCLKP